MTPESLVGAIAAGVGTLGGAAGMIGGWFLWRGKTETTITMVRELLTAEIKRERDARESIEKRVADEFARRDRESIGCKADCLAKVDSTKSSAKESQSEIVAAINKIAEKIDHQHATINQRLGGLEISNASIGARLKALEDRSHQ